MTNARVASPAEIAWAAGLFEGEGTVAAKRGTGNGWNTHRHQAAIIMTDEDVIRRFGDVIGLGKVYGPYTPTNPKAKPIWRWTTTRNSELEELHALLGPWLGERRSRRFQDALEDQMNHPAQTYYSKLSADIHAEIRVRYRAGGITQMQLAQEHGITQSSVSTIVRKIVPG